MATEREKFDTVLDSYRNGQFQQFTKQLHTLKPSGIADWVGYVCSIGYERDLPEMMKCYFRIRGGCCGKAK